MAVRGAATQTRIQHQHWRSRERAPELHEKLDRWAIRADLMGWVTRWSVMARLVAMGYNVMMMDTDVVLTQELYPCVAHLTKQIQVLICVLRIGGGGGDAVFATPA